MSDEIETSRSSTVLRESWKRRTLWFVSGMALVGLHLVLLHVSPVFGKDLELLQSGIIIVVSLELAASAIFLFVVFLCRDQGRDRLVLAWVIAVGLAMRAVLMPSTPMLEDDYFRYLWDGAVLANGHNPYRFAPAECTPGAGELPCRLRQLSSSGKDVLEHVNYPHLRTIYPPVAQVFFAISHVIKPWSVIAWRVVLNVFDVGTLVLLFVVLRSLGLSSFWVAVYWWSPLVVKEVVNSAHVDVILLPFVIGAVYAAVRGRHVSASVLLAFATGIKVWPVLLLPVVLAPLLRKPTRLVLPTAVYGAISAIVFLPVYLTGLGVDSGLAAYTKTWEMNDGLYMLILWAVDFGLDLFRWDVTQAQAVTRILVTVLLAVWIVWLSRRQPTGPHELWERALVVTAALFLLSPTQFPWYYLWVMPFLAVSPRPSLLLLSGLLPIYYSRFFFVAEDRVHIFDYGMVWVEYVPVWCLLVIEWFRFRAGQTTLGFRSGLPPAHVTVQNDDASF